MKKLPFVGVLKLKDFDDLIYRCRCEVIDPPEGATAEEILRGILDGTIQCRPCPAGSHRRTPSAD